MSDINIDVDVDDDDLARLEEALLDGLEDGMGASVAWLTRKGQSKAKSRIRSTDRVWRRKVYHGWSSQDIETSPEHASGQITNLADHARVVDEGLAPAGEITGSNPQVQDIIKWVSSELYPAVHDGVDLDDWDPELQALAAEYSPGYVLTAFAVRDKLDREGYPGIDFTGAAEQYLERVGPMVVQRKVEKRINRKLREYGVS